MARTLESFSEVGYLADNDKHLIFESHLDVRVSVIRNHEKRNYTVKMFFRVPQTDKIVAVYETSYATLEALMDDFGIDDIDEVWEVLE